MRSIKFFNRNDDKEIEEIVSDRKIFRFGSSDKIKTLSKDLVFAKVLTFKI